MNKRAISILEYNKIIEMLSNEAGSQMAKERIARFSPRGDILLIRDLLSETTEAAEVIVKKGTLPIGELYDTEPLLYRVRKGGALTLKQLLMILYNMKITENVVSFLNKDLPHLSVIHGKAEVLETFPKLRDRIDRSILSEDEMADSASPELARIRRDIGRENDAIRAKLNNIVNSQTNRTYLQDAIVTMRGGRYVVPVKAEHRQKIAGIVHDQSGSGSTLFIEPQAIVEANNRLRELELMEMAEIEKILQDLSDSVAEHFHELLNNQRILVDLDIIFAKGRLSVKMKAEEPQIDEGYYLELREARHPLIDPKKVVPINVKLGKDFRTLVITGPNTGGKTVTLKTIGLLSMMAMTGLHIPAASSSRVPAYREIFCDIGDEQSIEQSLSTFSSHMKNTVEFIGKAGYGSLVFLDELGAGTDPTEGAALAIAILETLKANEACVVATTHYNELKKFAIEKEGVQNASMEFDVDRLCPTYKLYIGIPGKSNAFEISLRLGLDPGVIDRARQFLKKEDLAFEDVLSGVEEQRKIAEQSRHDAQLALWEAEKLRNDYEKEKRKLDEERSLLRNKAREDARDIVRQTRREMERLITELRNIKNIDPSILERAIQQARDSMRASENDLMDEAAPEDDLGEAPATVKAGESYHVISIHNTATVLKAPDARGMVQIQAGVIKMNVPLSDLRPLPKVKKKRAPITGKPILQKIQEVKMDLDLRGMTVDDGMLEVDRYIDLCARNGRKEFNVIHGKGTGALRAGIQAYLKTHPRVKSYRIGGYGEGDAGVTVVTLK